eukprot:UN07335
MNDQAERCVKMNDQGGKSMNVNNHARTMRQDEQLLECN